MSAALSEFVVAPKLSDFAAARLALAREDLRSAESLASLHRSLLRALGDRPLDEISRADADHIRARSDLRPRTRRNYLTELRALLRRAKAEGLVDDVPVPPPHGLDVDGDPLWRDEATFDVGELAALTTDPRVPSLRRDTFVFLWSTGVRPSELGALGPESFNWKMRPYPAVIVTHAFSSVDQEVRETKARKPRAVPLTHDAQGAVERFQHVHWPKMHGRAPVAGDPLIAPRWGRQPRRLRNDTLWDWVAAECERLGLRHHGAHEFRATFISFLQLAKVPATLVERLTHGVPSGADELGGSVLAGYFRPRWDVKCAAVDLLPRLPGHTPQLSLPFT